MRLPIIAGIVLIAMGAFIVFQGLSLHSQGSFNVGPIHGTVQERHTIPVLFGWLAIVGGGLLTVAVARRRGR
jgi:hypothetical protein